VNGSKKRRPAAVILPDYAARVTVLDFDSFPSDAQEQLSLVRFRVKKSIPFDVESAAVSYFVQPPSGNQKKIEVLAVTVALEVIARYEALFRAAGFHPGLITTSTLAALNLYRGEGVVVVAKLSGNVITVTVLAGNAIKLFRCVTLEEASEEEVLAVLHPTFAYVEDELGSPARRLILCGFPQGAPEGMRCEVEPLRSRFGAPGPFDAGLLGYMELVEG
jgi:type IV pilus assembly protein PilM